MSHTLRGPKQIEFEYNLASEDKDVVIDSTGEVPCCEVGDILMRRDKSWKVTQVLSRKADSGPNTLLTLSVSLCNAI